MTSGGFLNGEDLKQIKALGLSRRDVEKQLAVYAKGPTYLKLSRPCLPGDGILSIGSKRRKELIAHFEAEAGRHRLLKFVPASGAASRMFAQWFSAIEKGGFGDAQSDGVFFRNLRKMPFFGLLKRDPKASRYLKEKDVCALLNHILSGAGLHYGWLPKALIPFHVYPGGETRTALEEQLVEAAHFIRDVRGRCHVHLTLSEEHTNVVADKIREVKSKYERRYHIRLKVDRSIQKPSTQVLAVYKDQSPVRDHQGRLVFRPGGHGALLENLETLDADFIFVKNIDNILPDHRLKKVLPYKKMLGGLAFKIQRDIFAILRDLEKSKVTPEKIAFCKAFCAENLNIFFPPDFEKKPLAQKKKEIVSLLDRPLRVCGMVRNEGEPGGGPFWVEHADGTESMQIVESVHVDMKDATQKEIWRRAQYFNPVDMVCCIKDFRGRKYNLKKFVDREAYLITEKMDKGHKLLAQELPGLWNGGMARWNTVFVELPLAVFNPVKTVDDLLRPEHRVGRAKRPK
jgi:hypothetical protein